MTESIYQPPKSDNIPFSKFEVFGGWLRFYQILHIVALIVIVGMLGMFGYFSMLETFDTQLIIDVIAIIIESSPGAILNIAALRVITNRNASVPQRINRYMGFYLGATLLLYIPLAMAHSRELITEGPSSVLGVFLYYLI